MGQADVNDTQRFYYLKDSLSGPALECMNGMFYFIHSMLILLL